MWAGRGLLLVTAGFAALLGDVYLFSPVVGSDLSAQVARAWFYTQHHWRPIDMHFYGGVNQFGYGMMSQPVMATVGVRLTGAISMAVTAVLFAVLLQRTGARRPRLGALIGVVCVAGGLVSGRVTYALGLAAGMSALVLLTHRRLCWLAAPVALITAATSPAAGLFTGLAGTALLLTGRFRNGLLLAVPAAIPVAMAAMMLGGTGSMDISRSGTIRAVAVSLIVALLVPRWPVRAGALLSAAGVLGGAVAGVDAGRLVIMFALPVLAAYAVLPNPAWTLSPVLALTAFAQPPVSAPDVRDARNPTADPAYFRPLRTQLAFRGLTGRVEVTPTRDQWETAYLGDLPLARGRGTGVPLDVAAYQAWLADMSVQYVAVPDADLSRAGRAEAALVTGVPRYLSMVWSGGGWRLFAVADPQPIVAPPAALVAQNAGTLTFDAPAAGDVTVRVRHYRWLRTTPRAVVEPSGEWTRIRVPSPGRYTLTSSLGTAGA